MAANKKKPLKRMGFGDYAERDTKLTPYTRERVNPRNWKDYQNDDEITELDIQEGDKEGTPQGPE